MYCTATERKNRTSWTDETVAERNGAITVGNANNGNAVDASTAGASEPDEHVETITYTISHGNGPDQTRTTDHNNSDEQLRTPPVDGREMER